MELRNVQILNLRKFFAAQTPVLDIPRLDFRMGELTCILGATGCGKTTLLNILAGVDSDFQGEVDYDHHTRPRVSYQFQKDLLLPWKSVRANVLTGYYATDGQLPSSQAEQWLDRLDLREVADSYPSTLSVGMRQRVALARALAWNGDLRLFDEPLSAQDFHHRIALETLLRKELRRPLTVGIVVTHNLEEAVILADRIIVLGGSPARVLDDFNVSGFDEVDRPTVGRRSPLIASYIARAVQSLSREVNERS